MRYVIQILILAISLISAIGVQAQSVFCVRAGATGSGNGSDWNNAYPVLPATLVRGATYYVAGGSYAGRTFSTAVSGTQLITIKKAIESDHGSSTGWSSSYGTAQAVFNGQIAFNSSYWVFDGQTGGGPGNWASGFGFKVISTGDGAAVFLIGNGSTANNISLKHVDMQGKGSVSGSGGSASNDGLAIYGDTDVTLSYAWMHGIGRCPFFFAGNVNTIMEYIYVQSYFGSSGTHSEVMSSGQGFTGDTTFRNNLVTDIKSTGGLMWDNSSNPSSHLYVYGNVFYKPAGATWEQANGVIGGWTGGNGEQFNNCWVFNNTFINVDQQALSNFPNNHSGGQARNNLFYNCDAPNFECFPTHNNNHFINSGGTQSEVGATSATGGDPFVNFVGLDFTLKTNTAAGANLGSPFNFDPKGRARTTWTRGAYEFAPLTTNAAISISPSSLGFGLIQTNTTRDLTITVQNVGVSTLAGSASVAAPFSIVSGATYSLGANQSQSVIIRYSPTVAGASSQTVTFTGGGGMTANVSGTATLTNGNLSPVVSAITQNATDVDPNASGVQIFEGTVVQYSGSATDPNGDALTWQWRYSVNGGADTVYQSGSGSVAPASFSFGAGTAGSTYVWKLRVSDGLAASESQTTVGVVVPPAVGGGLAFEGESGVISAPFVSANGAISQSTTTDLASGGRAVYSFTVTNAGVYFIQAYVDAPSLTANSLYVNIDAEPVDPNMAWDILPPTVGYENRLVSWRGNGTADANEFVPKMFTLGLGTHQLIIRGREAGTQLDRFAILKVPSPPQNLRILAAQ